MEPGNVTVPVMDFMGVSGRGGDTADSWVGADEDGMGRKVGMVWKHWVERTYRRINRR